MVAYAIDFRKRRARRHQLLRWARVAATILSALATLAPHASGMVGLLRHVG